MRLPQMRHNFTRFLETVCLAVALAATAGLLPACAAKSAAHTPALPSIRVTCVSTPIKWAAVRAAKAPMKAAAITYVIGSSQTVYEVFVSPAKAGVAWRVVRAGDTHTEESGVLSSSQMKNADHANLHVVVRRLKSGASPGQQSVALFSRFSPEYWATLVVSPKALPAAPIRTRVSIDPNKPPVPTNSEPGAVTSTPWLKGPTGYAQAMKQRGKAKKPVVLLFEKPGSAYTQEFEDFLAACTMTEFLSTVGKVRLSPGSSAQAQAIAARYGVKSYPSLMILPRGKDTATLVYPAPGKDNRELLSKPCNLVNACKKAAGT